jgi:ribose 5-phosphate isomerase RpiB
MKIAVVTEISTRSRNRHVLEALDGLGHDVANLGMSEADEGGGLTYIQTGLISALLLGSGAADLVIGGCGTGQGYMNSVMQYPGVACGLIETPLDAWLFRKINGGNCVSLALNKGFGWAGDVNLRFVIQCLLETKPGEGYPEERKASQAQSRGILKEISSRAHLPMHEIVVRLDKAVTIPALTHPGVMEAIESSGDSVLLAACKGVVSS